MESSITDWIQAVCSVLGLIGLIVTVYKLLARDKNREEEIRNLVIQAQNSSKQTELQNENNNITKEFLGTLSEMLIEIQKGKIEEASLQAFNQSQYKVRKNDLKPFFLIKSYGRSSQEVSLRLINKGNVAYNINFETIIGDKMFLKPVSVNESKMIERDETIQLSFSYVQIPEGSIELKMYYNDLDENNYTQTINFLMSTMKFTITDPLEIKK